jgi:hypothetical protein
MIGRNNNIDLPVVISPAPDSVTMYRVPRADRSPAFDFRNDARNRSLRCSRTKKPPL